MGSIGLVGSCVKDEDVRASNPVQHARTPIEHTPAPVKHEPALAKHTPTSIEHVGEGKRRKEPNYEQGLYANRVPDLVDQKDHLCTRCAGMKIERTGNVAGVHVMELGTTESLTKSPCPLCHLLASISPCKSELLKTDPVYLRIFSARTEFAGQSPYLRSLRSLKDSVLLSVVSQSQEELKGDNYQPGPITRRMIAAMRESGTLFMRQADLSHQQSMTFSVRFINSHGFNIHLGLCWLEYCRSNHNKVCNSTKLSRPTALRLIDCKERKIIRPTSWVEYTALSYVWGTHGGAQYKIDDLMVGDAIPELPKTIEDSIVVTKRLGIRYLWVDRYCIKQQESEDKLYQIQQMDAIYRCAEVTIIAAAGDGPDHGLAGINKTPRSVQRAIRLGQDIVAHTFPHPNSSLSKSTWATRGWTYQEGILSRRRLIFTQDQVLFECDGMHCRESLIIPLDEMHLSSKQRFKADVCPGSFHAKRPGQFPLMFMRNVSEYYSRNLSYPSDALNAMEGIFKSFREQPAKRAVYNISGIPIIPSAAVKFNNAPPTLPFLTNLFWHHTQPGIRRSSFPSWSWSGWQSGTILPETFVNKGGGYSMLDHRTKIWVETPSGKLHKFDDIPMLPNSWSACQESRFLHIESCAVKCTIIYLDGPDLPPWKPNPGLYAVFKMETTVTYARFFASSSSTESQTRATARSTKKYLGLVLPFALCGMDKRGMLSYASVLVLEDKGKCFERLGICHIYNHYHNWTGHEDYKNRPFHVEPNGEKHEIGPKIKYWYANKDICKVRLG